jgi:hypothetical protein
MTNVKNINNMHLNINENMDNSCNILIIRDKSLLLDCSDGIFALFQTQPTCKVKKTICSKTNLNSFNELLTMNTNYPTRCIKPITRRHMNYAKITYGLDNKIGNNFFWDQCNSTQMPTKVNIQCEITSLDDILKLINDYPIKNDIEYNINMQSLHNIKPYLEDLNNMIGMELLKTSIVDQIIYFIQGLNTNTDFMHTVIFGPPGTGKTDVAKIMGNIFSTLGVLKNNKFKKVTRSDLIAGYLGQTAIKTRDVIKSCLGGVIFIDEAYSLGNNEIKDSFAKECIDTLCELLSDHKSELMVIIAGYEKELNDCFFAYNEGLNSRFPWRFHTGGYSSNELKNIFIKKINDIHWSIGFIIDDKWFDDKMEYFKYYGRDMETLLSKIKITHAKRVFCLDKKFKKILSLDDINKGFDIYLNNGDVKQRKTTERVSLFNMYV